MPLEKSAGAVIFYKEQNTIKYLLLHYRARHWDLPKGHIEKGEKPKEAAEREVQEETGIKDIRFIPGFEGINKYFYRRESNLPAGRQGIVSKIVVFFLAETKTKEVKISLEHEGFKWLPYEDALKQITFKNAKKILQKANNFIQGQSL